jgi:3-methyladenine DNA glycosylase AlkD
VVNNAKSLADRVIRDVKELPTSSTPALRSVRRRFTRQLREDNRLVILQIAELLIGDSSIDRFIAYEVVCYHRGAFEHLTKNEVERLGRGISSWSEVDSFACYIAGPAWLTGKINDQLIHSWAHSRDRWKRRAALVSTVPLNASNEPGAPDRTLAVCEILISDRDDMVVKAMSWALRKLSTRNRTAVETFLANHRSGLAARIIREVESKLRTGVKSGQRRSRDSS